MSGTPCTVDFDLIPVFKLFLRVQNQWILSSGGHLLGLDCAAIKAVMDICQTPLEDRENQFDALKVIEKTVCDLLNKNPA